MMKQAVTRQSSRQRQNKTVWQKPSLPSSPVVISVLGQALRMRAAISLYQELIGPAPQYLQRGSFKTFREKIVGSSLQTGSLGNSGEARTYSVSHPWTAPPDLYSLPLIEFLRLARILR
jgi:hypothetical protein